MKPGAALFLLGVLAAACSPAGNAASPTELPAAEIRTAAPPVLDEDLPAPSAADPLPEFKPQLYELDVLFDFAAHTLRVGEEIHYTNNTAGPIDRLQFVVEAQRLGAGFAFTRSEVFSGPGFGETELAAGLLQIPLDRPLEPGETIHFELGYELVLPEGRGTLSWTERQTNFIDWYPYLPPYVSGQGWLVHEAAAVGEHEVFESANFEVHIEVANAPASLQVAAPVPVDSVVSPAAYGGETFDYELIDARRFVWSASGQYEVLNAQSGGGIPVSIYFFGEHRNAAEAALRTATQALDIYSELFGAYPYESLAIVDAQFFDGMESDGIFLLDQTYFLEYNYSPRNYLTALTAHEVAHNWWFGQVGNDQALEPWLDEALCIYAELLYYENTYPEMINWWWEFRIDRFHPEGQVDSTIYDHSGFESYVRAVYMRGAQFLQNLRNAVSEGPFFNFLHDLSAEGAGRVISAEDFFAVLSQNSAANIEVLIAEYFESR